MQRNLRKALPIIILLMLLLYMVIAHIGRPSSAPQLNRNTDITLSCTQTLSVFSKKLPLTLTNHGTSDYICSAWPYLLEYQKGNTWYKVEPAILHPPVQVNETAMICPPGESIALSLDLRLYGLYLPKGQYRVILDCYTTEAKQIDAEIYHSTDYLSCLFEIK